MAGSLVGRRNKNVYVTIRSNFSAAAEPKRSTCLTGLPRKTDRIASRISVVVSALISIPIFKIAHSAVNPGSLAATRRRDATTFTTRKPETKLNSPSGGGGSPVRLERQHSAVAQEGQRQMDHAGRHIGFRRIIDGLRDKGNA